MIVCPACSHRNSEEAVDCARCGASLEHFAYRACPACGALNPAQNTFCQRCLTELMAVEAPVSESEAEPPASATEPLSVIPDESPSISSVESDLPEPVYLDSRIEDILAAMATPETDESESAEPEQVAATQEPAAAAEELDIEPIPMRQQEAPRTEKMDVQPRVAQEKSFSVISGAKPGPLDEVEDALPLETSMSLPHRALPLLPQEPTDAERQDAALFRQIAEESVHLVEQPRQMLPDLAQPIPTWIRRGLYAAVLLAALLPFITRGITLPWIQPREAVSGMVRAIDALPSGSAVLISFDYTPAYAEELSPLAKVVTQQLAENSIQILAMSTKSGGVGVADQVLRSLPVTRKPLQYGEDYVLLGYLPGEEMGLRVLDLSLASAFASDPILHRPLSELAIMQDRHRVEDLDMVIVLTEDQQSVRYWIEQIKGQSQIELWALTTSQIEPAVIPYAQSGQLAGLLAGAPGATEYAKALGTVEQQNASGDAYAAYFVILLLATVLTNALYLSQDQRHKSRIN